MKPLSKQKTIKAIKISRQKPKKNPAYVQVQETKQ